MEVIMNDIAIMVNALCEAEGIDATSIPSDAQDQSSSLLSPFATLCIGYAIIFGGEQSWEGRLNCACKACSTNVIYYIHFGTHLFQGVITGRATKPCM
jgi:hypothetical protein